MMISLFKVCFRSGGKIIFSFLIMRQERSLICVITFGCGCGCGCCVRRGRWPAPRALLRVGRSRPPAPLGCAPCAPFGTRAPATCHQKGGGLLPLQTLIVIMQLISYGLCFVFCFDYLLQFLAY